MDSFEEVFQNNLTSMQKEYDLSDYELNDIISFMINQNEKKIDEKLIKRVTKIFSKKNKNEPFIEDPFPEQFFSVIPLFHYISDRDRLEQYGSGVLLEIDDNLIILTASHVLENERSIYFPIESKFIQIIGECHGINSKSKIENNIDIGYIKIEEELSVKIKNNIMILKEDDCYCSDKIDSEFCTFTGFPYRKSKIDDDKKYQSYLYEYIGLYLTDDAEYKTLNCNIKNNIIIRYNFENTTNRIGNEIKPVVSPEGISGGGIFINTITKKKSEVQKVNLVGIGHSFDKQKKILIGTKIDYCISFIRQTISKNR